MAKPSGLRPGLSWWPQNFFLGRHCLGCPLQLPLPAVSVLQQSRVSSLQEPLQHRGLESSWEEHPSRACSLTPALGTLQSQAPRSTSTRASGTTEPPDGPSFSHFCYSPWVGVGGHTCEVLCPTLSHFCG